MRSSCRWCRSTAGRSSSSSMTQILVRISTDEKSRYLACETFQPDFCQHFSRYSWSSVWIYQNVTFRFWLFIQNEAVRCYHICKHEVCFIHFTTPFSMAVFSLFSHSINSTLDQGHPLFPPPKCFTFFSVSFCDIQSYRFLRSHRWGISDQYTHAALDQPSGLGKGADTSPTTFQFPGLQLALKSEPLQLTDA